MEWLVLTIWIDVFRLTAWIFSEQDARAMGRWRMGLRRRLRVAPTKLEAMLALGE